MRRLVAGLFLIVFTLQSSGTALAATDRAGTGPQFTFGTIFGAIEGAVVGSQIYAVVTGTQDRYAAMHAPPPTMERPQTRDAAALMRTEHGFTPRIRHGVRQPITLPAHEALDRRHPRRDPLAMRKSRTSAPTAHDVPETAQGLIEPLRSLVTSVAPRRGTGTSTSHRGGPKEQAQIVSDGTTGIEPWWTYEERAIPGIGKALVNVGTGNLLVSAVDVNVPEQGISLAFQRVYNAQSLHDHEGDDGGDPAIFGDRWTNNFDANIVYNSAANTITVYDIDGAACTYTSNGLGTWQPCTGEYATLAPTDDTDCTYAWTKKTGTIYLFHTDDASNGLCTMSQAKTGHLEAIYARNLTNYITFTYSYDGLPKNSENVSQIVAAHSDGQNLTLNFGHIPNTTINELINVTLPDGQEVVQYSYDTNGNLVEVDKPGNNSAASVPTNPNHNITVPQGDAPETYAYTTGTNNMSEACGPRCTVAMWNNPSAPTDGSALLFTLNAPLQLTGWQVNGVLNFTPTDGTSTMLQPSQPTGFVNWYSANFVYGSGNACQNASAGTTTMCDSDGHGTVWTTNGNDNVTKTQHYAGLAENLWLTTDAAWDTNDDLISTTDANGNVTEFGYDTPGATQGGNVVEMLQPAVGDIYNELNSNYSPLSTYSYDGYNNVTSYCDPVYNQTAGNTWTNTPTDSLCAAGNQKTAQFGFYYTDGNEPFGCMTSMQKPGGYATAITYATTSLGTGTCGGGLPGNTSGSIQQYDGTTRTPTADFTYDAYGNLHAYDEGTGNGNTLDSWTLTYDADNQLYEATQNDAVMQSPAMHSWTCRYLDGSTFYTETPSQHQLDGQSCPSVSSLMAGSVTPPPAAAAHYYDLDGDETRVITHKGCPDTTCSGTTAITKCAPGDSPQPIGTTCKYYDGLDRLVETAEPYDTRSWSASQYYEFNHTIRWMNRYIYDLSMLGGSANLSITDATRNVHNIVAYGGLFKTQEYLPQLPGMIGCYAATAICTSAGPYTSASWSDVRGSSFDGIDRVVNKYELAYGTTAVNSNTYDASGQYGLLSESQNAEGQTTSYTYDNLARTEEVQFGGPAPVANNRIYTYDADGRVASISSTSSGEMGTLSYTYDVDGNMTSVAEPNDTNNGEKAASLICYNYYGDGLREYVSIFPEGIVNGCNSKSASLKPGNGGIEQPDIFSYSYTNDGRLKKQYVNWASQQLFQWTYYPSGREDTETDPLTNKQIGSGTQTFAAKTYTYDAYGRVATLTLPEGFKESSPTYDLDDETTGYNASNGTTSYARQFALNARGEMLEDTNNDPYIGPAQSYTQSANGVAVGDGDALVVGGGTVVAPPTTIAYDERTGMVTCVPNPGWALGYKGSDVYQYDGAGRETGSGADPNGTECSTGNGNIFNINAYDAEDHLTSTTSAGTTTATAQWGPDGRQRIDTLSSQTNGNEPQSAHWDGGTMLFSTDYKNVALYIGKFGATDVSGDLQVEDRDQSGTEQSMHGDSVFNSPSTWYNGWSMGSARSIALHGKAGGSITFQLFTGTCGYYNQNGTYFGCPVIDEAFTMQRSDGYAMVGGIAQGARIFDPTNGQWTTPDAYAGDVNDPISQKPFMWNDNNALQYSDPTGYDANSQGIDGSGGQPLFTDWSLTGTVGNDVGTFGQIMTKNTISNSAGTAGQEISSDPNAGKSTQGQGGDKVVEISARRADKTKMVYTYQLRNAQGVPQPNTRVYEHLQSLGKSASFSPSYTTTDALGEFNDDAEPLKPLENGHYVIKQTFSLGSNSGPTLSTTFLHSFQVSNGTVIINFGVLQP